MMHHVHRPIAAVVTFTLALLMAAPVAAQPTRPEQPAGPVTIPETAAAEVDPQLEQLLDDLERAAEDLHAFTATIIYRTEEKALLGRRDDRLGELIYHAEAPAGDGEAARRRFALLLNRIVIDGRMREEARHYIFDGEWLAEIDHENKQFIKRQIVAPGRSFDPLKLGEGPLPIPIGQRKADVLARFHAEPFSPPDEGLLAKAAEEYDVRGLALIPREGTPEAEDFQRIELLYDAQTLLPVGVRAVEANDDKTTGDEKIVRLSDLRLNPELTPDLLAKLDIREPDASEWAISIQPWVERQGEGSAR